MSINISNIPADRWATLLICLSNRDEVLPKGLGNIVETNGDRTIVLNKPLNEKEVVDITKNVLRQDLNLDLLNRIFHASQTILKKLEVKKQYKITPSLTSFAVRFTQWATNYTTLAKILVVISFGYLQQYLDTGTAILEKSKVVDRALKEYKPIIQHMRERSLAFSIEKQQKIMAQHDLVKELEAKGNKRLVLPDAMEMFNSTLDKDKFFNAKIVTAKIPDVDYIDIQNLNRWYKLIEPMLNDTVFDDSNKKSKQQFQAKFESSIYALSNPNYLSINEKIENKLLMHLTWYFKRKEDEIKLLEEKLDLEYSEDIFNEIASKRQDFHHELIGILVENLGAAFFHCSDRVTLELKNIYYETIAYNPDNMDLNNLENQNALFHIGDRRRLYTNIVRTVTQDKDTHLAATLREYEGRFVIKFGMGSTELTEKSDYQGCVMRQVPMVDLNKPKKILDASGKVTRIDYEQILDEIGNPVMMDIEDAIHQRIDFQYTSEHVLDVTLESFNAIRDIRDKRNKKRNLSTVLLHQWFRQTYAFENDDLLDKDGKWRREAMFVFLRDQGIIKTKIKPV